MQLFGGGLSQRVMWWIAGSSGIKLLIHAEPCYCSCHSCCQLEEEILVCSALMESLQGLLFRLLLGMVTKRQNKFSRKWYEDTEERISCDVRILEHMFSVKFKISICLFACLPSWVIFFFSYYPVFLEFEIAEAVIYVLKNSDEK